MSKVLTIRLHRASIGDLKRRGEVLLADAFLRHKH